MGLGMLDCRALHVMPPNFPSERLFAGLTMSSRLPLYAWPLGLACHCRSLTPSEYINMGLACHALWTASQNQPSMRVPQKLMRGPKNT